MEVYDTNILANKGEPSTAISSNRRNTDLREWAWLFPEWKSCHCRIQSGSDGEFYWEGWSCHSWKNRYESQLVTDGCKLSGCQGANISKSTIKKMAERDIAFIQTPHDTFYCRVRLINQSIPVKYFMSQIIWRFFSYRMIMWNMWKKLCQRRSTEISPIWIIKESLRFPLQTKTYDILGKTGDSWIIMKNHECGRIEEACMIIRSTQIKVWRQFDWQHFRLLDVLRSFTRCIRKAV